MNLKIEFTPNPSAEDIQILGDGIQQNATLQRGHEAIDFFAFFLRDEEGKILGGCNGCNLYGCLYIDQLWVHESCRNQGYGKALVFSAEKYGLKAGCLFGAVNKPIHAFIIFENNIAIGYIQLYNAHDFPRAKPLEGLPANLSALDIFIGEESALHKGFGSKAINDFLKQYHDIAGSMILVDPDRDNKAAIRCYEKAGFRMLAEYADEMWMIRDNMLQT